LFGLALLLVAMASVVPSTALIAGIRDSEFLGFANFSSFTRREDGTNLVLESPLIKTSASMAWDELVVSWNYRGVKTDGLKVEAQVVYPDLETGWYCLGEWALETGIHARASVKGQQDWDGQVETDTLVMKRKGGAARVRVTLRQQKRDERTLAFLGLAFHERNPMAMIVTMAEPIYSVWGKEITVPERSQADYPEGVQIWCSPTSLTMVLGFWATKLGRPELNYDVPEVARGVHDPNWPGTGNWAFNTAFAGAHAGMRAYVARLGNVMQIEEWIQAGLPVIASVTTGYLHGKEEKGTGHLIVVIGFTDKGDVVANDPGRKAVRQIYSRENFGKAWAESGRTVYLIYPEGSKIPRAWGGHTLGGHWFGE